MNEKPYNVDFRLSAEAMPKAFILTDQNGSITFTNGQAEKLFLCKRNELIGKNIQTFISEKYHLIFSSFFSHIFNDKDVIPKTHTQRLFISKCDGKEVPVKIELNPMGSMESSLVLMTIIETDEKKNADHPFHWIVESAPNSFILVDYSGQIVMVNKQTERLFGYTRGELIGKHMDILIPEQLRVYHEKASREFYTNAQVRQMGAGRDLFGVKKDKTEVPVEIGLNPVKNNGASYVLASIIDITERKKIEDELRLYTSRLENKNSELEQFTYIASHDLREPLNSIISLIELFIENESQELGTEALHQLAYINDSVSRMRNLVTGLSDYARLGKNAEIERVDFNKVVEEVISDLKKIITDSKAKITVEELAVIPAMQIEIRLLFQNLISNALKYKSPNRDPEIKISAQKVKGGWQFAVSDNGIGIPSDQKDKIFILFQRLHGRNEYGGIGLGLAHCKKIIDLHDGKIWVESELNRGSIFYFIIPINN